MRAIVVGGGGFLGGAVARELAGRGDEVVVVDNERPVAPWDPGVSGLQVVVADIADRAALARAFRGADEVYHLAGRLGTSELERELRAAVEVNVVGTLNVFDAAVDAGVATVVLACKPNVWLNAYTITKEASEKLALLYGRDRGLRVRCLRYFNAYGPRQHLVPVRKLVPTFAASALRGLPLPVFGDGAQTVDLLHVQDLARVTVDVARAPAAMAGAVDCGSGVALSVEQVARLVNELAGNAAGILRLPMRLGEPERTTLVADTAALEQLVGPLALTPLEVGLASTLDWYAQLPPGHLDAALATLRPPDVRVLVVIAHPDDETLGCGGYLARLADEGHEVRVLSALRRSDPRGRAHWDDIVADLRRACAVLGATAVLPEPLLEERDADVDVRTLHEVVEPCVDWSELVLTHWTGDVHQVHRSVSRAVEIATRPFRRRRDVLLFEVATSTDQAFTRTFSPQCYVTLEPSHVERKLAAMACYRTEGAPGRDVPDVEAHLRLRGAEIGVAHAEAFVVARQFR